MLTDVRINKMTPKKGFFYGPVLINFLSIHNLCEGEPLKLKRLDSFPQIHRPYYYY
jgi:hypothetical protein